MKSLVPIEVIEKKILLIGGKKVILDKDLAALYSVTTGNLNKAMNPGASAFPAACCGVSERLEYNKLP